MRSTFFGLEIGRKSVLAQQRALDVVGHNVANANTPGYSRQEALMVTSYPDLVPSLSLNRSLSVLGTGVSINEIVRIRSEFYDRQYREQNVNLGKWELLRDELKKVELLFSEGSDTGLSTVYDQFWQGWQELSKNPESLTVRTLVKERAAALADTLNNIYRQLNDHRADLEQTLYLKMEEVNSYARQIADLNAQILAQEVMGGRANDLRDRQDYLIDQLSRIINLQAVTTPAGTSINVGSYALVDGITVNPLGLGNQRQERGIILHDLIWAGNGQAPLITGGEIAAILEARDQYIPAYLALLDDLVSETIFHTNELHMSGYGLEPNSVWAGRGGESAVWSAISVGPGNTRFGEWRVEMTTATDFTVYFNNNGTWENLGAGQLGVLFDLGGGDLVFTISGTAQAGDYWTFTTPQGAATNGSPLFFNPPQLNSSDRVVTLNPTILDGDEGLRRIAASTVDGEEGNGENALLLAQLKDRLLMSGGAATYNDFIRSLAGRLGVEIQQSARLAENQGKLVEQVENLRQGLSSVSLDEEMANMIRFQQAYNAAARLITAVDETLEVIVNRMGLVGR